MVNVLLVGNGAREHVIAETLKKNSAVKLFSFMSARNPGIDELSEDIEVGKITDTKAICSFAKENKVEFAFIGPEAPLEAGVVDALDKVGIKSIGPKKILAQIETSKAFTRNLLNKYKINCNPKYRVFTALKGIKEFMYELNGEYVVKADGLCGGKGVKLSGEHLENMDQGMEYCVESIARDGRVVIEEKLIGQEFSYISFSDGKNILDTIPVQDHKRAFVEDKGPNTGGMGSYSDSNHLLPFLTKGDIKQAHDINQHTINAIYKETGERYIGILYGGFIATKNGVKLIEYNARFGDPEVMNILPILKTDLLEICLAMLNGTLNKIKIEFEKKATVCKYIVPKGYPDNPVKGKEVDTSKVGKEAKLYFASVDRTEGKLIMSSSRAIGVVGIANTLAQAELIAENAAKAIKGPVYHREDIGTSALIQKRIDFMKRLRAK